ncbi:MAG: alanine--tRNA ligase, partial [Candidatus Tectomicrobia bacterium]|nr:alanine--tRNA ligase [Candidatus Tectomicrobia bacterium]
LYKVTGIVTDIMGEAYPELLKSRNYVAQLTKAEEEQFVHTLNYGLRVLDGLVADAKERQTRLIPGFELFRLYDTFGFPLDLAQEVAEEQSLTLDQAGFEEAMEEQRTRARASWKGTADEGVRPLYRSLLETFGPTSFLGYTTLDSEVEILAILKREMSVETAGPGDRIELLLDKTPFYGEAGGQVGDKGQISGNGVLIEIEDCQRTAGLFLHRGVVKQGTLYKGAKLQAVIDGKRRQEIVLNHTATHLLHAALRRVLGDHVKQSGSLVAPDRLRFDFNHFSKITPWELERIEDLVNEKVRENIPLEIFYTSLDEALKLGAMALFGEKYGDEVRVVKVGDYSLELCGGIHVKATGDIGVVKLTHEGGVAAGVRRVEALTGHGAYTYIRDMDGTLAEIRELLKAKPFEELEKMKRFLEHSRVLEKELDTLQEKFATSQTDDLLKEVKIYKGVKVLASRVESLDERSLRTFIDQAKQKLTSGVVVVGTVRDGHIAFAAGVTKDLTEKLHAGKILQEVASITEGSGGGRADMAQAGGKNPAKLKEALEKVYQIVERELEKK